MITRVRANFRRQGAKEERKIERKGKKGKVETNNLIPLPVRQIVEGTHVYKCS